MKSFVFCGLFLTLLFVSCNEDNVIPEPTPTCKIHFKDSTFVDTINGVPFLVYRICTPINNFENILVVFENVGYMKPKKRYAFEKDTVNNCMFLDLYEYKDWVVGDEFWYFSNSRVYELMQPEQTLLFGRIISVNSCEAEWKIKYKESYRKAYLTINGKSIDDFPSVSEHGYKTLTVDKNGTFMKGQTVSGWFFFQNGQYVQESLSLQ